MHAHSQTGGSLAFFRRKKTNSKNNYYYCFPPFSPPLKTTLFPSLQTGRHLRPGPRDGLPAARGRVPAPLLRRDLGRAHLPGGRRLRRREAPVRRDVTRGGRGGAVRPVPGPGHGRVREGVRQHERDGESLAISLFGVSRKERYSFEGRRGAEYSFFLSFSQKKKKKTSKKNRSLC